MTDLPQSRNDSKPARTPTARELLDSAKRLKSQALYVGATRLVQESRHLRESNEHTQQEVEKFHPVSLFQGLPIVELTGLILFDEYNPKFYLLILLSIETRIFLQRHEFLQFVRLNLFRSGNSFYA